MRQRWAHYRALRAVSDERNRQEELKKAGRFEHTCADPEATDPYRLGVLVEEVGEVAKAINEGDAPGLKAELAQVAAVAVAWLESIEMKEEQCLRSA